jgi:hypothetical protein
MQPHPPLEKMSWIASIVSAIIVILSFLFSGVRTFFGFLFTLGFFMGTLSLIPWNLLFYSSIGRKRKINEGIQKTRLVFGGISIVCLLFSLWLIQKGLYMIYLFPPPKTPTPLITPSLTSAPTKIPTFSVSSTITRTTTLTYIPTNASTFIPPFTSTPKSTSTIEISPTLTSIEYSGFCGETPEPCLYLPKLNDSWPIVAENTSFQDGCKWPLIANLNRKPDGTYRAVAGILFTGGIFVPPPTKLEEYRPQIRYEAGIFGSINDCIAEAPFNLPCVYKISQEDGITGSAYELLASKFYKRFESPNGISLDTWIASANLADGCKYTNIRLFPGVSIVIPVMPP